jgi:hypothetical protein
VLSDQLRNISDVAHNAVLVVGYWLSLAGRLALDADLCCLLVLLKSFFFD